MDKSELKDLHDYEISIRGHLSGRQAKAFNGFEISLTPEGNTLISGKGMDQAALFGVLIRIRDFGMHLLSVVCTG